MSRAVVLLSSLIVVVLYISGCAPKFACEGSVNLDDPRCNSVSNMYDIKMRGKADTQVQHEEDDGDEKKAKAPPVQEPQGADMGVALVQGSAYEAKVPVRVPPKVIRIWIAPWEDADGDLHQPGYIFSEINDKRGRWVFGERQVSGSAPLLSPVDSAEEEQPVPPTRSQPAAVQDRQSKASAREEAQAEKKAQAEEQKREKLSSSGQKDNKTTADKWGYSGVGNSPTLKLPSVKK